VGLRVPRRGTVELRNSDGRSLRSSGNEDAQSTGLEAARAASARQAAFLHRTAQRYRMTQDVSLWTTCTESLSAGSPRKA
jgi:hypothetical protein